MTAEPANPPIYQEWKNVHSVADVYKVYPERIQALFAALDLDRPELAGVKTALARGDAIAAAEALLEHYRSGNSAKWLRRPPVAAGDKTTKRSESILEDQLTFQTVTGKIPRDPKTGSYEWRFKGPKNDKEFAWFLNRHGYLKELLDDYFTTGNPRYVQRLNEQLKDWVVNSYPYPAAKKEDGMWRGLEASFRVKVWSHIFYGLMADPQFSPAARLLLLSSLPEQAHYLRNFYSGNNWITMELSALATLGLAWPEFRESADWVAFSKKALNDELSLQIYPDGAQHELTSMYHFVALDNFEQLAKVCREAGSPLPEMFSKNLEKMWDYLAGVIMPNGRIPLNSDSDSLDMSKQLLRAAERYNRPDWRYIATQGREGEPPKGLPSILFPWAGQFVSRSGWDADAQWSFFDIGPWGSGHQQQDHLHLSIFANGRDFLVDSGRFAYFGDLANALFYPYARLSRSHNTILIDDLGQLPGVKLAEKPLDETRVRITPEWDYAASSFSAFEKVKGAAQSQKIRAVFEKLTDSAGYEKAALEYKEAGLEHQRAVFYLRGRYWVVLDRVITQKPRQLSPLWHFHPKCEVKVQGAEVVTVNPEVGNLRITPAGPVPWKVEIVSGKEGPDPQGWYSVEYNRSEPSPTAVYHAKIPGTTAFAWVMLPAKGQVPPVKVEWLQETPEGVRLRVTVGNDPPDEGFIPFQNAAKVMWK